MDEKKKTDRRVVKTKKAIYHAVSELLTEKEAENITVSEIADKADINRKTFYNYYKGVYQVFDEIEDMLIDKFDDLAADVDIRTVIYNPGMLFALLSDFFAEDQELYRNLFLIRGNNRLAQKFTAIIREKTKRKMLEQNIPLENETMDIMLEYISAGLIASFRAWYSGKINMTIDQLSGTAGLLCAGGFASLLEKAGSK